MNPLDLNEIADLDQIFNLTWEEEIDPTIPDGLEFSPKVNELPAAPAPQAAKPQPMAQAGAAPAAPVQPRPTPTPAAKAAGGYSDLKPNSSSQQDSRADSLFEG